MTTHSSILAWRIPWTEEPEGYSPEGCYHSDMTDDLAGMQAMYQYFYLYVFAFFGHFTSVESLYVVFFLVLLSIIVSGFIHLVA